jgi:hypothetical protein
MLQQMSTMVYVRSLKNIFPQLTRAVRLLVYVDLSWSLCLV